MKVDFGRQMKHYTLTAEAPGLEIKNDTGGLVQLSGLHMEAEQERLFDDVPGLYAGSSKISLAQLSFVDGKENPDETETAAKQPLLLKQLSYDASIPVNGEFIDLIGKVGVESAQLGEQNFGPAHYDFSLRHLHARSTATLYQAMMKWYADPAHRTAQGRAKPFQGIEVLREPALALLQYSPEFHLDRISFNSPQGEAKISAEAKLGALQADELSNPLMLIGKLDAHAELALPADLVKDTLHPEQLDAFIQQGFITRHDEMLLSKVAFSKGRLTVNDKPFNPMAMGSE